MRINTTRFGLIDVAAGDVIRFPSGLPGLEDCREFALLADAANDAVGWLQSTTRGDVALAVVSPRRFVPDYRVRIPRSELHPLALAHVRDAQIVVVVGTSGLVYPAAGLPDIALARGGVVVEVNPEPTPLSSSATVTIRESAGIALPGLLQRLPALLE
jgi:hypothetical protein